MNKKALLMILDGWGIGNHSHADVIYNTPTPYLDYLMTTYPNSQLQASGENVGLPDGQMGNSEVGHLNIGAGRVVYQDLVKINIACRDNSILKNPEIVRAFTYARDQKKKIHFLGLVSDGGVHSSFDHLLKLIDIASLCSLFYGRTRYRPEKRERFYRAVEQLHKRQNHPYRFYRWSLLCNGQG
jgi:2,3-bisphosphoglycerate-independent phosphoglycerate mutase